MFAYWSGIKILVSLFFDQEQGNLAITGHLIFPVNRDEVHLPASRTTTDIQPKEQRAGQTFYKGVAVLNTYVTNEQPIVWPGLSSAQAMGLMVGFCP